MQLRAALFGALWVAGIGLIAGTVALAPASAEPVPPPGPEIPLPGDPAAVPTADPAADAATTPPGLLGQLAQVVQSNPFATVQELLAESPQSPLIGMAPPAPGSAPVPDPYTMAQALQPQNFRMPTADQVSPYALAPNDNPSQFARLDAFRGVHALAHSNLGRLPGDQLGQPLPGTAPPPGTNLPAGLEQFYAAPEEVPMPPDAPPVPATSPAEPVLLPPIPPN